MTSVGNLNLKPFDTLLDLSTRTFINDRPNPAIIPQIEGQITQLYRDYGNQIFVQKAISLTQALKFPHPSLGKDQIVRAGNVLIDTIQIGRFLASVIFFLKEYKALSKAIQRDDLATVQTLVEQQGLTPRYALLNIAETTIITNQEQQRVIQLEPNIQITPIGDYGRFCTGLGIAGIKGALKVLNWLLSSGENPNFFIQYSSTTKPYSCISNCGDDSCLHQSFLPPWFSVATDSILPLQSKLEVLSTFLNYGADPLLRDSDGNFWLMRCVRPIEFDPAVMHLLLSAVSDLPNKAFCTNLKGKRVSLLENVIEEYDRLFQILLIRHFEKDPSRAPMPGSRRPLSQKPKEFVQKWQRSFFANTAVLISHGMPCTQAMATKIDTYLRVNFIRYETISLNPSTTVTATTALALYNSESLIVKQEIQTWKSVVPKYILASFLVKSHTNETSPVVTANANTDQQNLNVPIVSITISNHIALIIDYAAPNERLMLADRMFARLFTAPNTTQTAASGVPVSAAEATNAAAAKK